MLDDANGLLIVNICPDKATKILWCAEHDPCSNTVRRNVHVCELSFALHANNSYYVYDSTRRIDIKIVTGVTSLILFAHNHRTLGTSIYQSVLWRTENQFSIQSLTLAVFFTFFFFWHLVYAAVDVLKAFPMRAFENRSCSRISVCLWICGCVFVGVCVCICLCDSKVEKAKKNKIILKNQAHNIRQGAIQIHWLKSIRFNVVWAKKMQSANLCFVV